MKLGLKLGKTPARPGSIPLRMADYLDLSKLPPIPANFGHEAVVGADWGVLGNDTAGNCVFAGGCHETMLWNKEAGRTVAFTSANALSDYSAVTGYKATDPSTDNGTDMGLAATYRMNTGLIDANGIRHKVAAALSIDAGNVAQLKAAAYLFSAVGIGIEFPSTAMDQFNAGGEWLYVHGVKIEGGHYVPLVGQRNNVLHVVTWGRVQPMSQKFFATYCDEAVAYLSEEMLINGKSIDGFDKAALLADLGALRAA